MTGTIMYSDWLIKASKYLDCGYYMTTDSHMIIWTVAAFE